MPTTHITKADFSHFSEYPTRWNDNDQYGHLNNAIYYHYFDSVINDYLIKHCGLTGNPSTTPIIGLVVSSYCEFYAPVSFPQTLVLGLSATKIGRSSVTYEVGVFQKGKEDGRPVAVGGYTHVFVDSVSRKSLSIATHADLQHGLERIARHPSITSKL
ncbi:thioesterase family protein [Cylindrobasidium torrendii FP15055 ss-10]|uniref:Thioesterase family protein n=1 Tax=Cylindrobasidium torrendii FP15055 ss-10 TaxID=1314674 RepID=A0A0D7BBD2_9AGAR|nr:thioesterase family protein [Cylindrobasidium torrendii FP15055 ss-10]